jgi:hypothetical protein
MHSRRQLIAGSAVGFALTLIGSAAAGKSTSEQESRDMDIEIKRNGSRRSAKGSPDWFTGSVRVDPLFQAPDPARVGAGQVTFEPGARTACIPIRLARH